MTTLQAQIRRGHAATLRASFPARARRDRTGGGSKSSRDGRARRSCSTPCADRGRSSLPLWTYRCSFRRRLSERSRALPLFERCRPLFSHDLVLKPMPQTETEPHPEVGSRKSSEPNGPHPKPSPDLGQVQSSQEAGSVRVEPTLVASVIALQFGTSGSSTPGLGDAHPGGERFGQERAKQASCSSPSFDRTSRDVGMARSVRLRGPTVAHTPPYRTDRPRRRSTRRHRVSTAPTR